jgi:hypothetical protein
MSFVSMNIALLLAVSRTMESKAKNSLGEGAGSVAIPDVAIEQFRRGQSGTAPCLGALSFLLSFPSFPFSGTPMLISLAKLRYSFNMIKSLAKQ